MNYEPGYKELAEVLQAALDQAQHGKGKDRHACERPFTDQPMMSISRMSGVGGPIYQAMKKAQESMRLTPDRAIAELLGGINYLAGAVLIIKEQQRRELGAGVELQPPTPKGDGTHNCSYYDQRTMKCDLFPNPVCFGCEKFNRIGGDPK